MNRRQRLSRAKRNEYLFAHCDADTAKFFLKSWDEAGVGTICEDVAESFCKETSGERIFTNDCRNKLTEYGNSVALKTLLSIPEVERACKFARFDFEELRENLSKGFVSEDQRQNFIEKRSAWFLRLKEQMKNLRISKETLESFGLNWKAAKSFAYQTI